MITNQELLNDLAEVVERAILSAVSRNKTIYIIELKIFKNTRLNQATEYTAHAVRQCYNDLMVLLQNLDASLYRQEIDWLNDKVMGM